MISIMYVESNTYIHTYITKLIDTENTLLIARGSDEVWWSGGYEKWVTVILV